jgi:integrase
MKNRLVVYRRHSKNCAKSYPQNHRVVRPRTTKETKCDCDCPIVASGSLANESKRLQHTTLDTNDWDLALKRVAQWEEWQSLTDPSTLAASQILPSIAETCQRFMQYHGPLFREWDEGTLKKYRVLLNLRLIPFCEENKIPHIHAFDDRNVVNNFVVSWRNLNPTRNRKLEPGEAMPSFPLGYRTKVKELEQFRHYVEGCRDAGWLRDNHAKKVKLKTENPDPKHGFEPEEDDRIFDAISKIEDGRGNAGGINAQQMRVFCLVCRHTGSRINAVANLDASQLVLRESGVGHAILVMEQQKTGWVRIPIPTEVYEALTALPFRSVHEGKQYWFRVGTGKLMTSIKSWQARMNKLFVKAKPFQHPATTHTWRHTFAISHLNVGVDVKMVSRWLGHASIAVTEKHYAHANRSTHLASENEYDKSLERQRLTRKVS